MIAPCAADAERVGVTACGQERSGWVLTDDAKMLGGDGGVPASRPATAIPAVHLLGAEECRQSLWLQPIPRAPCAGRRCCDPAELGDEFSHRAIAPQVAIPSYRVAAR